MGEDRRQHDPGSLGEGNLPPELEHFGGFPLIAFIRPDGTVHAVYGGWFSEATGRENQQVKAQFTAWARELVATPHT